MDGRVSQGTDDGKPRDGSIDPAPPRDVRGARLVTHEPRDAFLVELGMPEDEPSFETRARVTLRPELIASAPFHYVGVSGDPGRLSLWSFPRTPAAWPAIVGIVISQAMTTVLSRDDRELSISWILESAGDSFDDMTEEEPKELEA